MANHYDLNKPGYIRQPFKAHKSWGQHYLTDQRIICRIIQSAQLSSADRVIEIGPGTGQLTRHLVQRAGKLAALDRGFP